MTSKKIITGKGQQEQKGTSRLATGCFLLFFLSLLAIRTNFVWAQDDSSNNQKKTELRQLLKEVSRQEKELDKLIDKAEKIIDKDKNGPLFLFLPLMVDFPSLMTDTEEKEQEIDFEKDSFRPVVFDLRKNSPGWNLTVNATHFTDQESQIEVNNLTLKPQGVNTWWGNPDLITLGQEAIFSHPEEQLLLAQSDPGNTPGIFQILTRLKLIIPANTPTGDYQSQLTFTIQ